MASLIFAILGLVFVLVGLIPLFGWLNWIGIVFLIVGMISGVSAQRKNPINKGVAVIGTILCIILLIISVIRLVCIRRSKKDAGALKRGHSAS